jgi:hypothetical protein
MKLFSEILILLLLLRNIKCGVTRNKRFLSYFLGGQATTPKSFDPSEEYYKILGGYKNPQFVKVYKIPSSLNGSTERIEQILSDPVPTMPPKGTTATAPTKIENIDIRFDSNIQANQTNPKQLEASESKAPILVPILPVSGGAINPKPNPQIRNPLYPRYLQLPVKQPEEFNQQLEKSVPSFEGSNLSIHEKVVEQELPHIHKQENFIPEKSSEMNDENFDDLFSSILQPPIEKRAWFGEENSHEEREITNFYHSNEFKKLMKEYKLPYNIKKLPDIREVMSLLGTTTLADTISTLKEVAHTESGRELIRDYLNDDLGIGSDTDESRGGEIIVSGESDKPSFSTKYLSQFPKVAVPVHFIIPQKGLKSPTEKIPDKIQTQKESLWGKLKHWVKLFISGDGSDTTNSVTETPKEIQDKFPGQKIQSVTYYIPEEVDTVKAQPKPPVKDEIPGNIKEMSPDEIIQSVSYFIPAEYATASSGSQGNNNIPGVEINEPGSLNFNQEPIKLTETFEVQPFGDYDIPIDVRGGNIRRNFEVASGPQRQSTDFDFVSGKVHKANPDAIESMIKTDPLECKFFEVN